MTSSRVHHLVARYNWYFIAALLLSGTALLLFFKSDVAHSFGEALIIAGVLADIVDPYLKIELVK